MPARSTPKPRTRPCRHLREPPHSTHYLTSRWSDGCIDRMTNLTRRSDRTGDVTREIVPAADVPPRLRKLAPEHLPYRSLSGVGLRALLAEHGVKVPSTKRRYPVDPAVIRARIAERATEPDRDGAPDGEVGE